MLLCIVRGFFARKSESPSASEHLNYVSRGHSHFKTIEYYCSPLRNQTLKGRTLRSLQYLLRTVPKKKTAITFE